MINQLIKYAVSMAIIFLCLYAGISIQEAFAIPLPGSIIGMLILFILLTSGLLPLDWVKPSASLYIKHMMFLFVPISVGLMVHFDTLAQNALPIFASAIGGSIIVLVSLSLLLDRILRRGKK